jgi:hypothetical protein
MLPKHPVCEPPTEGGSDARGDIWEQVAPHRCVRPLSDEGETRSRRFWAFPRLRLVLVRYVTDSGRTALAQKGGEPGIDCRLRSRHRCCTIKVTPSATTLDLPPILYDASLVAGIHRGTEG